MGWRESRYGFHISEYNGVWKWTVRDQHGVELAMSPRHGFASADAAVEAVKELINFIIDNGFNIPVTVYKEGLENDRQNTNSELATDAAV